MTYRATYKNVLQKNFMLVIIAIMLLFPTFFIWAGVPFFLVGGAVESITTSFLIIYVSIAFSGGILFSLYFLPINLKVARSMAAIKENNTLYSFLRLELIWVLVGAAVWGVVLLALLFVS